MKKQLLIASLLCGLAALPASAQVRRCESGTCGFNSRNSTDIPYRSAGDEQGSAEPQDTDADTQQTGRDRMPQSDQDQGDRNSQSTDEDRSKEPNHRSEYQSQLENALQKQPALSGVHVNFTDTTVELTGAVPTNNDKHQARMMAQDYANGRKVVDHITVSGK